MSTINETKGFYKLSWLQRIGFGSGDLAQIYSMFENDFLLGFKSNIFLQMKKKIPSFNYNTVNKINWIPTKFFSQY